MGQRNPVNRYVALGVDVGNLGRGRRPREPMTARVDRINRALMTNHVDLHVIAFYGHTGNLVIETESLSPAEAGRVLSEADGVTWIVLTLDILTGLVQELTGMQPPKPEPGIRWTSGLIFAVTKPIKHRITSSPRGHFRSIGPTTVATWKQDRVTTRGRLDSRNRDGGWGRMSQDVGSQTNSRCPARSLRTLRGTLRQATSL